MKPDTTYILARILGPLLVAIGVALITQTGAMMTGAMDFLSTEGLRVVGAVMGIGIGLTLAVLHTRFDGITATLITLVGWVTLARGIMHLLAPSVARDLALIIMDNVRYVPIAGCVMALIGVWLAYAGYIAGTLRVETTKR